ncbi:MAG: ABC transporter permease subunit [Eubacteriales bacterium]
MKPKNNMKEQMVLQSMVLPAVIVLIVFSYGPMYGAVIAFKDYNIGGGMFEGAWVGLKYFKQFLTDPMLFNVVKNTLVINVLGTLITFPAPIILALMINELPTGRFKKFSQTISYLPHFLSWVIFAGLILEMLRPSGVLSDLWVLFGLSEGPVNFMAQGSWFYIIFIVSSLVKGLGYGSIIYVAALSGVDQEIYEAGKVDGCTRLQRIWYLSLPSITGTIVVMLILQIASLLNTGIEQILMFQNSLNLAYSETLDSYVYKVGVSQARWSYSTAVNLLKSVISVFLLVGANKFSKKITGKGLF